jgi:hypothetical protein
LCPTLYRGEYGGDGRVKKDNLENEIREEFAARAPGLLEGTPAPDDDWGWYFLMQHFGAPTRLLDWTEVPLVALYFAIRDLAVKDNEEPKDAVVWALNPYELNKEVIGIKWVICPDPTVGTRWEKELVKPWLPERHVQDTGLPRLPIAVYPAHTARRISTQRSNFTIHGSYPSGLAEMPTGQKWLSHVDIPSARVQGIRKELEHIGIDETMAYPDLGGLGRSLRLKWRLERAQ